MSGDIDQINARKNSKKKQNKEKMLAFNEARKKARLLIAEPPAPLGCIPCGQCQRADQRILCGHCGYKNSMIDTSKLDLSGHQAVKQVYFGKDSL